MELGESAVGALVVLSNGNGQYIGTPGFVVGGQWTVGVRSGLGNVPAGVPGLPYN